jgi:cytosine/uracil/thiamine/allantoin permease
VSQDIRNLLFGMIIYQCLAVVVTAGSKPVVGEKLISLYDSIADSPQLFPVAKSSTFVDGSSLLISASTLVRMSGVIPVSLEFQNGG